MVRIDRLSVVLLDLANVAGADAFAEDFEQLNLSLQRHTDWRSAVEDCRAHRPDLTIVAANEIDETLAEVSSALRHANAGGEVFTVLLVPESQLANELIADLGFICAFAVRDDWSSFAQQVQLAAISSRRVQTLERAWFDAERALQQLGGAMCSIDVASESCVLSGRLKRMLGLDGRFVDRDDRSVVHWRDLLLGLDELGQARLESAITMALMDGTPLSCQVGLVSRSDIVLACNGSISRNESGEIKRVDLTWQKLKSRGAGDVGDTVVPMSTGASNSLSLAALQRVQQQSSGTVLFLRIDNFPELCRTLGFVTGQRVLSEFLLRLNDELRSDDLVLPRMPQDAEQVAQVGGAEVVVVLDGVAEQDVVSRVVDRILTRIHQDFELDGRRVPLKIRSGTASWPRDAMSVDDLMISAALAADYAIGTGAIGEDLANISIESARDSVRLEADLYDAVLNRELMLHYQPKYDLSDGTLVGVEALLRWHRHHSEWVPPDVFIPIAERNGLISSIGRWVVEEAVSSHARWFDMGLGRVKMAINISPEQLLQPRFVEDIVAICQQHDVPAEWVELEVTESCLIGDSQHTVARLQLLRARGFSIALDDFGTGFSSLSYLRSLPLDVLKIDRSFLSGVGQENFDPGLLVCIIGLGLTLGLSIVAEGVEEPVQWKLLGEWGCHIGQGYLMSKPLPEETLMPLLENAAWADFETQSA